MVDETGKVGSALVAKMNAQVTGDAEEEELGRRAGEDQR